MPNVSTSPSSRPPTRLPGGAAEAAERDDDQRGDRVGLAHRRRDLVDHRQQRAGHAGERRGPTPKTSGCSTRGVDADELRAGRRLHHRAHRLAEQREAQHARAAPGSAPSAKPNTTSRLAPKRVPRDLDRLGEVVVAAQVARPTRGTRRSAPGTSARSRRAGCAPRAPRRSARVARDAAEAQPVHDQADQEQQRRRPAGSERPAG